MGDKFSLDLVRDLSRRQREHGLRSDNYSKYVGHCSTRLKTIRSGLRKANIEIPGTSKECIESDSLIEITDRRQLEFILLSAERSWAKCMLLRDPPASEDNIDPDIAEVRARHRHHAHMRKLRKAARVSSLLVAYTRATSDAFTVLSCIGYHSYLSGLLAVEGQDFALGLDFLSVHLALYGSDVSIGVIDPFIAQDKEFQPLKELQTRYAADGLRRFCRYQISASLDQPRAQLDSVLDGLEKKAVDAAWETEGIVALVEEAAKKPEGTVGAVSAPIAPVAALPRPLFFDLAFNALPTRDLTARIASEKAKLGVKPQAPTKAQGQVAPATAAPAEEPEEEVGGIRGWIGRWKKK